MTPIERARQLNDAAHQDPVNCTDTLGVAREILVDALANNPNEPDLLVCLGAVLCDLGRHLDAVPQLEKAIHLGSTDRNAYLNLAIALMNCDASSRLRAGALFETARRLEPSARTWEAYFDPQAH